MEGIQSEGRPAAEGVPGPDVRREQADSTTVDRLQLKEKVALVWGAPGTISTAVASALADAGAEVAVTSPTDVSVAEATAAMGRRVRVLPIAPFFADQDGIVGGLAAATESLGRIDIFVNSLERSSFNAPYVEELAEPRHLLQLSVLRLARTCELIGQHMSHHKSGSVITITAPPSIRPWPDLTAATLRLATLKLTRAFASKWLLQCVRFYAITPDKVPACVDGSRVQDEAAITDRQFGRRCTALNDVTDAVVWLASDPARHISGAHLPLDGGQCSSVTDSWQHLLEPIVAEASCQL
jgi:NAD(P)-dependent dehydrogenase (short-subunit alcohol dehydrogenase family)